MKGSLIVASLSELRHQSALFDHLPVSRVHLIVKSRPTLSTELTSVEPGWLPVGISDGSAGECLLVVTTLEAALGDGDIASAQSADEVSACRGLGLDVIRLRVQVGATSQGHATRDGRGAVGRVQLVDTVGVVRVDDSRDVEVGQVAPAVEGHLTQHAGGVLGVRLDGIPVADPSIGEVDRDTGAARNRGGINVTLARGGGEVNGAISGVQRLEGDLVGSTCQSGKAKDGERAVLHVDCWW